MPEDDLRRRVQALEAAQRSIERDLERLAETVDRMTTETMIEREVMKRLHARASRRVDLSVKLLGAAVVAVQVITLVLVRVYGA